VDACHQLGVDQEVVRDELEAREDLAPEQLEGAVEVTDGHAEHQRRQAVEDLRDEPSQRRVLPVDAEAENGVVLLDQAQETLELPEVELVVGFGVEDELASGGREALAQRGARSCPASRADRTARSMLPSSLKAGMTMVSV